jgi:hypothetical protein
LNLPDRFRRLSLWNKLRVLGALASLVGLLLSILAVVPRSCTSTSESAPPEAARVRQEAEPTEKGPRRDLSAKELVLQLEVQLRHLHRFLQDAESDPNMVREVGAKANLLAGTEDGLLLHLMDHFSIWPKRMIGNALGQEPLTLPEYLDKTAQIGRTKDGRLVTLTYRQLIHFTATEEGGIR